jgi:subtilisin family serine protease
MRLSFLRRTNVKLRRTLGVLFALFAFCIPTAFAGQPLDPDVDLTARRMPLRGAAPERLLELAAASDRIAVIVGVDVEGGWKVADTRHPEKSALQRRRARDTKEKILHKYPSARRVAGRDFESIPYFVLVVDAKTLRKLMNDDDVVSIEENAGGERTLIQSTALIGSRAANLRGYGGAGTTVAVLDDGVQRDHSFLQHSMWDTYQACFSGADSADQYGLTPQSMCPGQRASVPNYLFTEANVAAPCPDCYHGTEVAGVIAGKSVNNNMYGVAPDAALLPIQVYSYTNYWCTGAGCPSETFTADVLAALDHVLIWAPYDNIAAVNMSFRFRTNYSTRNACINANGALGNALATLLQYDIAPVVAAGNDATATQFSAPSCLTSAYVVGASTDADTMAPYSNFYSHLSFFAPGGAAGAGNGIWTSALGGGYTETLGTSLAAPHVSGAFALLRQRQPNATTSKHYSDLRATGVNIALPGGVLVPRINVNAALNRP